MSGESPNYTNVTIYLLRFGDVHLSKIHQQLLQYT